MPNTVTHSLAEPLMVEPKHIAVDPLWAPFTRADAIHFIELAYVQRVSGEQIVAQMHERWKNGA